MRKNSGIDALWTCWDISTVVLRMESLNQQHQQHLRPSSQNVPQACWVQCSKLIGCCSVVTISRNSQLHWTSVQHQANHWFKVVDSFNMSSSQQYSSLWCLIFVKLGLRQLLWWKASVKLKINVRKKMKVVTSRFQGLRSSACPTGAHRPLLSNWLAIKK